MAIGYTAGLNKATYGFLIKDIAIAYALIGAPPIRVCRGSRGRGRLQAAKRRRGRRAMVYQEQ
jgi:hypothetical protein